MLLSIGPTEAMHFQTWHDKAGNAPPLTDPTNGLEFPNLNAPPFGGEEFQTNLIMPEPTIFLKRRLPVCSIVRPTNTQNAAMGAVEALTDDGLFIGQPRGVLHETEGTRATGRRRRARRLTTALPGTPGAQRGASGVVALHRAARRPGPHEARPSGRARRQRDERTACFSLKPRQIGAPTCWALTIRFTSSSC